MTRAVDSFADDPRIVGLGTVLLGQLCHALPPDDTSAAGQTPKLLALLRRSRDMEGGCTDADCAASDRCGRSHEGLTLALGALDALYCVATRLSDACPAMTRGGQAFLLIACTRKYMASPEVACRAGLLLAKLAGCGVHECVTALVIAGAVPLVTEVMELHGSDSDAVCAVLFAFRHLAADAATALTLAEERPVRLLCDLLRRHIRNEVVQPCVTAAIAVISAIEGARAVLLAPEAAVFGLLLEAARTPRDRNAHAAGLALRAVAALVYSHEDFVAARKAGVGAAALAVLRDRPGDVPTIREACALLANVLAFMPAMDQFFDADGPGEALAVLERHTIW